MIREVQLAIMFAVVVAGAISVALGYGFGAAGETALGDGLRIGGWWAFGLGLVISTIASPSSDE